MIGVPCLVEWASDISSRMCCPYSGGRRKAMKRGPARIEISIAARPAIRTRTTLGLHRRQRFRYRLEPHRPRTLDQDGVARTDELVELAQRLVDVRRPARRDARSSVDVPSGKLSDGKQLVDLELLGRLADLAVVRRRRPAELRHVTENRNPASVPGTGGEIAERGSHRHRVRVVGVVDQQAAAGQLTLLAAPLGELD